jgi:hypothetical protein
MKIVIVLACGELSRFPDFWDTAYAQLVNKDIVLEKLPTRKGGSHQLSLNMLTREFLATDGDAMWLLNDDQVYPQDTLQKLINADKDIVIPLCLQRNMPFRPIMYDRDDGDTKGLHFRYLNDSDRGLIPIVRSGGGGMLIKRYVLEAMSDPWWEYKTTYPEGTIPNQSSEDINFCRQALDLGFTLWCDTDAPTGHVTNFTIWPTRNNGKWVTDIERAGYHIMIPAAQEVKKDLEVPTKEELEAMILRK